MIVNGAHLKISTMVQVKSSRKDPLPGKGLPEFSVGQLAARSGVAVSALHFYEREGLLTSRRTAGNQRRYARDALRRVSFIRVAQQVGIPLAEIREALDRLPDGRAPTRA